MAGPVVLLSEVEHLEDAAVTASRLLQAVAQPHAIDQHDLLTHGVAAEAVLEALRAEGVQLAVDDFGTGYSSLSSFRQFPINTLEIDQSFIRRITTTPDPSTIVTAVISMGRSRDLRVVAEGVETEAELTFLEERECDEAQGFFFSRPLPPYQFAELFKQGGAPAILN